MSQFKMLQELLSDAENSLNKAPESGSIKMMKQIFLELNQIIESKNDLNEKISCVDKLRDRIDNVFNGRFITPVTQKCQLSVLHSVAMLQDILKSQN